MAPASAVADRIQTREQEGRACVISGKARVSVSALKELQRGARMDTEKGLKGSLLFGRYLSGYHQRAYFYLKGSFMKLKELEDSPSFFSPSLLGINYIFLPAFLPSFPKYL